MGFLASDKNRRRSTSSASLPRIPTRGRKNHLLTVIGSVEVSVFLIQIVNRCARWIILLKIFSFSFYGGRLLFRIFVQSSCCLGGLVKSQSLPDRTLKAPTKRNNSRFANRRRRRQWSSSPEKMENNVSISHSLEAHLSSGPATVNEENKSTEENVNSSTFVNEAAIAWNKTRQEWVGDRSKKTRRVTREPIISWCTTYEDLLSNNHHFQQPIPLPEMVDFLVDIWQEEGLYD